MTSCAVEALSARRLRNRWTPWPQRHPVKPSLLFCWGTPSHAVSSFLSSNLVNLELVLPCSQMNPHHVLCSPSHLARILRCLQASMSCFYDRLWKLRILVAERALDEATQSFAHDLSSAHRFCWSRRCCSQKCWTLFHQRLSGHLSVRSQLSFPGREVQRGVAERCTR